VKLGLLSVGAGMALYYELGRMMSRQILGAVPMRNVTGPAQWFRCGATTPPIVKDRLDVVNFGLTERSNVFEDVDEGSRTFSCADGRVERNASSEVILQDSQYGYQSRNTAFCGISRN
jgi:hypothetical protein